MLKKIRKSQIISTFLFRRSLSTGSKINNVGRIRLMYDDIVNSLSKYIINIDKQFMLTSCNSKAIHNVIFQKNSTFTILKKEIIVDIRWNFNK